MPSASVLCTVLLDNLTNFQIFQISNMPSATAYSKKRKALTASMAKYTKRPMSARALTALRVPNPSPGPELKAFDQPNQSLAFLAPSAGISYQLLNNIDQGTDLFQRVGRKISGKSIQLRGFVRYPVATTGGGNNSDLYRVMVIYDTRPNGQDPTISEIFSDANNAAVTTGLSFINLNNRDRFRVIMNKTMTPPQIIAASGPAATDGHNNVTWLEEYLKVDGMETIYNQGKDEGILDIQYGAFYIVCTAVNNTIGLDGTGPKFEFQTRYRYVDF